MGRNCYAGWSAQPEGPWSALLREAADQYVLEVATAEVPVQHFKEWLAEWGREIRRRQSSLLLLSAHRAKGLEFRHVAVLDGSWDRRDSSEDPDAARRLYYVAMTRAQETLTLVRGSQRNDLVDTLSDDPCLLRRDVAASTVPRAGLLRIISTTVTKERGPWIRWAVRAVKPGPSGDSSFEGGRSFEAGPEWGEARAARPRRTCCRSARQGLHVAERIALC